VDGRRRETRAHRKIGESVSFIVFGERFNNQQCAVHGLYATIPGLGIMVGGGFRPDGLAPDHVSLHRDLHSSVRVTDCSPLDSRFRFARQTRNVGTAPVIRVGLGPLLAFGIPIGSFVKGFMPASSPSPLLGIAPISGPHVDLIVRCLRKYLIFYVPADRIPLQNNRFRCKLKRCNKREFFCYAAK